MKAQEIFTKAVNGLRKQAAKSFRITHSRGEECAYRGEEGRKCAIGHVLPDEKYCPEMEGLPVTELRNDFEVDSIIMPSDLSESDGIAFLIRLQSIHDSYLPSAWENKFKDLTLDFPILVLPPLEA